MLMGKALQSALPIEWQMPRRMVQRVAMRGVRPIVSFAPDSRLAGSAAARLYYSTAGTSPQIPHPCKSRMFPSPLLERVVERIHTRHLTYRTEKQYVAWIRRFIRFHGIRHPESMGKPEVEGFLSHLAVDRQRNGVVRAKRPLKVPVVLGRDAVRAVLAELDGVCRLVGLLLYGSGLRLNEALTLRVKGLDLDRGKWAVRSGKGQKDRVTVLPKAAVGPLREHLLEVERRHETAEARGYGGVEMPLALMTA